MDVETEGDSSKIQELEKQVAALKKENTKLKNEMRFNLDQEKCVSRVETEVDAVCDLFGFVCVVCRRSSGEFIASLQRDLSVLETRNEELCVNDIGCIVCLSYYL